MALSLGDGGVEIARGVEHPVRAVGEAASLGVEVSEGGHNEAGAGAGDAVIGWNEPDVAYFVPQRRVVLGFQIENRFETVRTGNRLEDGMGGKRGGNDHQADGKAGGWGRRRTGGVGSG